MGHAQGVRRQGDTRRIAGPAQPLACAGDRLGLSGRQECVRGEAGIVQHFRGTQDGGGRQEIQCARADRLPEPLDNQCDRSHQAAARRRHWRRVHGPRALPQTARLVRHRARQPAAGIAALRPLARTGTLAPLQREAGALQLALALGYRQRRHGQPGSAPVRYRTLGPGQKRAPGDDLLIGRDIRLVAAGVLAGDAQPADLGIQVCRRQDP